MEPKLPAGKPAVLSSVRTLPDLPSEAGANSGAGTGTSAVCVRQLVGSLELRLSKQLSDMDRKLDLLAVECGSNFDHLNTSLLKARPPSCAPQYSQQPLPGTPLPQSPMAPPSNAPSLGVREGNDEQSYANWMAAFHTNCSTPFGGGGPTDTISVDRPAYIRSNTHRSGAESACESVPENLPESILKRRPSIESTISPLFAMMQRVRPSDWAQRTWTFLEDPESSRAALWYSRLWAPFIAVAVAIAVLQTVDSLDIETIALQPVELCFDVIFLFEALIRYCVCPSTLVFVRNPLNFIDVLAALPLAVRSPCAWGAYSCEPETWAHHVLFNVSPTLRLLKTLRHFQQFHLFLKLLKETREALSVLLFTLCIIVLAFSSLIYIVEPRDNIASLPKAMYLVIVTISTVGYGDVTPKSTTGSVVITATIVCSVLYMAMPIGIIGNAFTEIWRDRDRILMTVRTRDRLAQWGYTAKDMQMLFRHFDRNHTGELTLPEFRAMIREMRIGIQDQDDRVVKLFESFDKDGSGGIDEREFTRALFPSAYHELYSQPKQPVFPQELHPTHFDPTRFLRLNFAGKRSDSKTSDKSGEGKQTVEGEGGEEKSEGQVQGSKLMSLATFPSFHSGRSAKTKGSVSSNDKEKAERNAAQRQGQDTVQKDRPEAASGVLMDVPPLFAVVC